MIDAGAMTNRPSRAPAQPAGQGRVDAAVGRGARPVSERGNVPDRTPGRAGHDAGRAHGGTLRDAEQTGHERPVNFLAALRAQLRAAAVQADGGVATGTADGRQPDVLDEFIDLEDLLVAAPTDVTVGYGATLLGLIGTHAELAAAPHTPLVDAGLVDGGLVDGGLVEGEQLDEAFADVVDVEAASDEASGHTGRLDEDVVASDAEAGETPAGAAQHAVDASAADAPPANDDEDHDGEDPEPAAVATQASVAARPARGEGELGEARDTGQARPFTPPDHLAPGSARSARPEFVRVATDAEAFRFATSVAPPAEANAEVAQASLRAAARMSALPPQVQRILDAAQRLENLPPPRQLTLDLGEVRVRVAMDDGGLRLSVLSGDSDVGDDLLRDAEALLEQQGFDLARDGEGDGEAGGDEQAGPVPDGRDQDAARARRARRSGLRL